MSPGRGMAPYVRRKGWARISWGGPRTNTSAICPRCGLRVALRKDGTMRDHWPVPDQKESPQGFFCLSGGVS